MKEKKNLPVTGGFKPCPLVYQPYSVLVMLSIFRGHFGHLKKKKILLLFCYFLLWRLSSLALLTRFYIPSIPLFPQSPTLHPPFPQLTPPSGSPPLNPGQILVEPCSHRPVVLAFLSSRDVPLNPLMPICLSKKSDSFSGLTPVQPPPHPRPDSF